MPRPKESEREKIQGDTRQRLLAAAADEFAREGYIGANINRISTAAGFAKGTVYNYFPSKRQLMYALIDEFSSQHLEFITEKVLEISQPDARLERFFEAGLEFIAANLSAGRVVVICLYGPDADFKQHLSQVYAPMFQLVVQQILVPGIAQGLFRPLEPMPVAGYLMTVYLGVASTADDQGRPTLDYRQLFDFTINGLRP